MLKEVVGWGETKNKHGGDIVPSHDHSHFCLFRLRQTPLEKERVRQFVQSREDVFAALKDAGLSINWARPYMSPLASLPIRFYNTERFQKRLGQLSPIEYREKLAA